MEPIIKQTTKEDQKIALDSISQFAEVCQGLEKRNNPVEIQISGKGPALKIKIPKTALSLLGTILENMAEGKSIALIPSGAMLSTQRAAEFLNVSRPHVIKLIEEGQIPSIKVGSHRRIEFSDLLKYKAKEKTTAKSEASR